MVDVPCVVIDFLEASLLERVGIKTQIQANYSAIVAIKLFELRSMNYLRRVFDQKFIILNLANVCSQN